MFTATRLRAASDVHAADWIGPSLGPFGLRVDSFVPAGFEAYVRIFHPVEGAWDTRFRWSEIAARSGTVMHPHAEFECVSGGDLTDEPRTGELLPDDVAALAELLRRHTGSAERCWFCIWEGGWVSGPGAINVALGTPPHQRADIQRQWQAAWQPSFPIAALSAPRVQLPGRNYVLLEGPLDAVGEIGGRRHWQGQSRFDPHSPNLWWPDDHAWCVATEIDLDSTFVGGTGVLVRDLLNDERLEALEVNGSDLRGDAINA